MADHRTQTIPSQENNRNPEREYGATIRYAKLCHNEKSLLRFYADVFFWEQGRCSEWSINRISAHIGWTPKTTREARNRLEALGWIIVHKRGYNKTHQIEVKYGNNDPRYDELECAKWWKGEGEGKSEPLHVPIPTKSQEPSEDFGASEDKLVSQPSATIQLKDKANPMREQLGLDFAAGFESDERSKADEYAPVVQGGLRHTDLTEW